MQETAEKELAKVKGGSIRDECREQTTWECWVRATFRNRL